MRIEAACALVTVTAKQLISLPHSVMAGSRGSSCILLYFGGGWFSTQGVETAWPCLCMLVCDISPWSGLGGLFLLF